MNHNSPKMDELHQRVAKIAEMERIKYGFCIKEWCALLGITQSSYKRFLSMESMHIEFDKVVRLAQITGLSIDDIAGLREDVEISETEQRRIKAIYHYIKKLEVEENGEAREQVPRSEND